MTANPEETKHGVSVVIPCLNEEESVGEVVDAVKEGLAKLDLPSEIIIVDNGCTDRSPQIAAARGARVVKESRRGYGAAIRYGIRQSLYSINVMGDADMTYDFTKLDELVRPILEKDYDIVIGQRMDNIRPGSMPWLHQYVGNPLFSVLLRVLFHTNNVKDPHCGMRAFKKSSYNSLHCVTTGMEFASEMVIRAIHNGLRIHEREIIYHPRIGESKLRSFKDGWRHLRFMLLHSPTMVLLIPGALGWLFGLMLAVPIAFGPIVISGRGFDTHFMIAAGILNVICAQMVGIGMIAKAYAHLSGLRKDPVVAWFYRWFTFEKAALAGGVIFLGGIVTTAAIVLKWIGGGFCSRDEGRPFVLAFLLIVNGVQFLGLAYLFSIMALPRRFDEENGRG